MTVGRWIEIYHRNYNNSYNWIMNKYVPSISIVSSVIGIIICILLWKLIYNEGQKKPPAIPKYITKVLIVFTLISTIGELSALISSAFFLYHWDDLKGMDSSYTNHMAEFLGMIYIWIRLSNSCIVFIMLLYTVTSKEKYLGNTTIIICVVGPFALSIYAYATKITGFNFTQLPLGSCAIVMVPLNPENIFRDHVIWNFSIEVLNFCLFVFCTILIIYLWLNYRRSQKTLFDKDNPLIPDLKTLFLIIPCVMMVSKAAEVIRMISVPVMFAPLVEYQAQILGRFNFSLMVIQAIFECAQSVLTYMSLIIFLEKKTQMFFFLTSHKMRHIDDL